MEWLRLTDICRPKQWKTVSGKDLLSNGYPVYGANGFIGYWSEYNHAQDTLTIACRGTCGMVNIVPAKSYINGNAMCLDDLSDRIILKFLYYYLKWYDFREIITGTTIPQITIEGLRKIKVPCLSLNEQDNVVREIDCAERLVSLRKAELSSLDNLVKARFVEMFGDPVTNPKNLPMVKLGELSELITKGASPKWQGFSYTDNKTQTLFITSENVREGFIDISSPKYVEDGFNDKQKRSLLRKRDFLVNIVGASIGRAAQYMLDDKANINQATALVRVNDTRINDLYLLSYLNSEKALQMYDSMKSDTGRANLSLEDISNLAILLPPLDEQVAYMSFARQIDKSKFDEYNTRSI